MDEPEIFVSAVVFRDDDGRVLTVRKKATSQFMLPGGKPDNGETPAETAAREVGEELGVHVETGDLRALGTFTSAAANEPGHRVVATVFEHPSIAVPGPAAEIDELRWTHPARSDLTNVAPLLTDAIFPALRATP